MRTTVTIDDDIAAEIEALRKKEGLSYKAALNHVLRIGLQAKAAPPKPRKFKTPTRKMGLRPGVDATRLNALVDELETDEFVDAAK